MVFGRRGLRKVTSRFSTAVPKLLAIALVNCCAELTQGCQMAYLHTKNPNLGIVWKTLGWKILVYFLAIWCIIWLFGTFYGHLVHFVRIRCILISFGILYQVKSGNPALVT
jgi:ribose/xylose/arabinose/galactoside ABC-type transport system permease subunit